MISKFAFLHNLSKVIDSTDISKLDEVIPHAPEQRVQIVSHVDHVRFILVC